MKYQGEQLMWGTMGHFFVVLAFVTAVFSVITNFIRTKQQLAGEDKWKNTARFIYCVHAISVIGIFVTLLSMVIAHRFEYQYVWQHSKSDMKMNYVLACIWEGQEGSTLLWLIWHSVIGIILLRRAKEWEAPVLTIVSLVQVFLSMMLLGLYIGDIHIGSDPFGLIRLQEQNIGLPWTKLPDYLTKIPLFRDGRGLNPLLQNYWMTIHPPTLFLGFALTTVPFAFAIAGLWTKKYYDWQKPALPWAFTGVMVLGTGILMGGAWAYESLSFGGFWAWDPVENASLVPWLVLVGAAHVMLLYRQKGQSLFTTFFLSITAFLLVVYSTFLTKSGILSDSSVHAFTDDGLNQELTAFMGFFLWLAVFLMSFNWRLKVIFTGIAAIVLVRFLDGHHASSMLFLVISALAVSIISYWKFFPKNDKEEELWSREFWMFIGSLVLLVASFQIIFYTSSPVLNKFLHISAIHDTALSWYQSTGWEWLKKIADANIAPDKDVVNFYNKWQISFAVVVSFLVGMGQFLKYKDTKFSDFIRQIRIPLVISLIITLALSFAIYFNSGWEAAGEKKQYIWILCTFLLFSTIFSVIANLHYWKNVIKMKMRNSGASIAHAGFGILLIGVVISTSKKETISQNTSRMDISGLAEDVDNRENIYLKKGDTLPMGDYFVTYRNHERKNISGTGYVYFNVDFLTKNGNKFQKEFSLAPFIQLNQFMGNAAEPDTKHFLHKDIYTHVKFVENRLLNDSLETTAANSDLYDKPKEFLIAPGDTIGLENCIAVLDSANVDSTSSLNRPGEKNLVAWFDVFDMNMNKKNIPAYLFFNGKTGADRRTQDGVDETLGVKFTFADVDDKSGKIRVFAAVKLSQKADYMVLQASVFPGINVLWIGCLIMVIGTFIAIRERIKKNKVNTNE